MRLVHQHFVLIDCPAGIDVGFINAISSATEAVIVTTPEITAIRDADRVAGLLEANTIYNVKRGNFVYQHRGCTSIYRPLAYLIRSLESISKKV